MKLLESVFSEYQKNALVKKRVTPGDNSKAVAAITNHLPDHFSRLLLSIGKSMPDYRVYGSVGPMNFSFAKIPWVAVLDTKVSKSTQNGYFIVLLFCEDMSGCFLSLNQGYNQYRVSCSSERIAQKQIQSAANIVGEQLKIPPAYIRGPINLAATSNLGKGYERGAIVSAYLERGNATTEAELTSHFITLLDMFEKLKTRVGDSIISILPPLDEGDFQSAALESAASSGSPQNQTRPKGPQPPPARSNGGANSGYKRNYEVAAQAIRNAQFRCELDQSHRTFRSSISKQDFVEAHHLFPMSLQSDFQVSLDVPENIIALCPNCHRLLHHGVAATKRPLLARLFAERKAGLSARGISAPIDVLLKRYRSALSDGD